MTTITNSATIGIDLNPALYTNPVVIATGVTITNSNYPEAVYRQPHSNTVFTIQNYGTITGSTAASGIGVYLAPGGSLTNAVSASITGEIGVKISSGLGTVVNQGKITASGTFGAIAGSAIGIWLPSGGLVINEPGASIKGDDGVTGRVGMSTGSPLTVVNYGTVAGTYSGISAFSGLVRNMPSASIYGELGVGASTIVN